ncbi:MAG: permease [Candidatus Methanomethylicia archaeon]
MKRHERSQSRSHRTETVMYAVPSSKKAVEKAAEKLRQAGVIVSIEKANIMSKEIVRKYGVLVSPAIAINNTVKIIGLIVVGYLSAFISEEIVEAYLTGVTGVLIASILGGPLYTPTLVEIALGQELWSKGMSKGALLSWLIGQPYDFANAMAVSRIVKWKIVATYVIIAWAGSVTFGLLYGFFKRVSIAMANRNYFGVKRPYPCAQEAAESLKAVQPVKDNMFKEVRCKDCVKTFLTNFETEYCYDRTRHT